MSTIFKLQKLKLSLCVCVLWVNIGSLSSTVHADTFMVSEGQALFEQVCSTCHELPDPNSKSWAEWIEIMVAMGHMANLSDVERSLILQYLISTYIAEEKVTIKTSHPNHSSDLK